MAADPESSVKNGGELIDGLLKDIVTEIASTYTLPTNAEDSNLPKNDDITSKVSQLEIEAGARDNDASEAVEPERVKGDNEEAKKETTATEPDRAFSLARFIPLLSERVYVIHPHTRMHLVSWVTTLDSVPDLEMVAWLPEFLDGLL